MNKVPSQANHPARAAIRAGVALSLLLGGCLDGSGSGTAMSGSVAGAWSLTQGECTQLLSFDGQGGFAFGVELNLPQGTWRESLTGQYTQEERSGQDQLLDLQRETTAKASDVTYCVQWARRTEAAVPLAGISAALGEPIEDLSFHQEISHTLGAVLVGTATDRTDRVALYRLNGELRAARLEGSTPYSFDLVTALPGDATRDPILPFASEIVNQPEAMYRRTFNVSATELLDQIVLNLVSASDVLFEVSSPGTSNPRCQFEAFEDLNFSTAVAPAPLATDEETQTLRLNPGDGGAPLLGFPVADGAELLTAYLLPIAIRGRSAGACTVTVRATATSAAVLEAIQQASPL